MSGCEFFIAAPEAGDRIVVQCQNDVGPGPLFFYVSVGEDAVRVPVCEEHAAVLASREETP